MNKQQVNKDLCDYVNEDLCDLDFPCGNVTRITKITIDDEGCDIEFIDDKGYDGAVYGDFLSLEGFLQRRGYSTEEILEIPHSLNE